MSTYDFLVETYRTERIKTLSVWEQVPAGRLHDRLEPRARSPLEHMLHQCISEDAWMRTMLGIDVGLAPLPQAETPAALIAHYGAASERRLAMLAQKPDAWFVEAASFFETTRSRAWILTRRLTHSAHHRGQLTMCLRAWGEPLYSTYGPTADTGGLPKDGGRTVYRASGTPLPLPRSTPATERGEGD